MNVSPLAGHIWLCKGGKLVFVGIYSCLDKCCIAENSDCCWGIKVSSCSPKLSSAEPQKVHCCVLVLVSSKPANSVTNIIGWPSMAMVNHNRG